MNKKENEQLKKIEKLSQQLDNTISKIGPTEVKPIKISKKKLALLILIPFSIACVISALTSFLLIDPFYWYTKPRLELEQKQEKEIKRIEQQFAELNLASSLDSSNSIADLLWEMKSQININNIVSTFNVIKSITSKKDNKTKLSSAGETINIEILVKTGSLEKKINIELLILIENNKVKQVNGLVKYSKFLNMISEKIKADGINRVSNLIDTTKSIINENDEYQTVFNDVNFDLVNDKNDDEIIASGLKQLKLNLNFIENDKKISSSVQLDVDLKGKTRKEINQYLANSLIDSPFSNNILTQTRNYFAQTVFANASTYQQLIDELISNAPENNFYLLENVLQPLDNSESAMGIDFKIIGKTTNEELNKPITIEEDGKWWRKVDLELQFFVGKELDRFKKLTAKSFQIYIMSNKYEHKNSLLYLNKVRDKVTQGLFKYKVKTKIGQKYKILSEELNMEFNRLKNTLVKPEAVADFIISHDSHNENQSDIYNISEGNLNGKYYFTRIYFKSNKIKDLDRVSGSKNVTIYAYIPVI